MGAVAVGATIYFGSEQSRRQLVEIAEAFEYAHELGMATILWCYLRNSDFKKELLIIMLLPTLPDRLTVWELPSKRTL